MADLSALDDTSSPAVRRDLTTASVDGELVIFDPVSSKVHQLDPIGSVIWQLLDGKATVGELIVDLAEGFGVPEAQVRADLASLLARMQEHDLLDVGAPLAPLVPPTAKRSEPDRPEYLVDPPAP